MSKGKMTTTDQITAARWTATRIASYETMGEAVAAINAELDAERKAAHWLGELLAVIHCDGGHYLSEHGIEKATKDAIKKRNEMVQRIDELETKLVAERDSCRS